MHSASAFEPLNPRSVVPTFRLANAWPNSVAISDKYGDYLYKTLFASSKTLADKIAQLLGENKVQERIALLCPNDASYVIMQWACWMNGHVGKFSSLTYPVVVVVVNLEDLVNLYV